MRLRYLLLAAFTLVAAVPLLLFWLWPHARLLSYELDAVRERHLLVAGTLAATLDSYHRQVVATFALVQESLGDADVAEDAGALLQALHFRNICLYDAGSGRLGGRVDSFDSRCDEQLDAATLTTFRALAAAPAGSISPVTAGPGGAPTLYLAVERAPLLAVGALYTDFLVKLADGVTFGEAGYATIVDQEGQVIAHPRADWRETRHSIADLPVIAELRAAQPGVTTFMAPSRGTDVIAGYAAVSGTGWGVIVAQPVAELRERAAQASYAALAVVVVGIVAAGVTGWLFARDMARRLREVSQAVRGMAAGDTAARTEVGGGPLVPAELSELQSAFNAMAEAMERSRRDEKAARLRAEDASRSKSAFLANMSHELRTPLNAVLGFTEVILAETFGKIGSARYTEYLMDIRTSARHLLALINDLLDLSRIEAGALKLTDGWMPLAAALEESATLFREICAAKGLTLRLELPAEPLRILADERALRQILINLLSNAVRHTPSGGTLTVGARSLPVGGLAVQVADTGVGIPVKDLERVLQPFEQVARGHSGSQEGTGLGLSIVKQLVELHGGALTLESAVGKGTIVTFTLPPERVQRHSQPPKVARAQG
ncbi:MAG TPA: sensor histidine kinase [Kiloniellaceae bacterium]|nr:sensor histidine kinase [Kiloniellaceae bacterium]